MAKGRLFAELPLGEARIVVMKEDLVVELMEALAYDWEDLKYKSSPFFKYPLNENETNQEWYDRVLPQILEEGNRQEGESVEDYMKRTFSLRKDRASTLKDVVTAIAKATAQESKVENPDVFKKMNLVDAREFCVKVFDALGLSIKELE